MTEYPGPGTPYGQPSWGQPAWAPAPPPKHGRSATALALGLVAVVGALFSCGLSLLLSPLAWILGQTALREMRASPGRWSGEGDAKAGMVLGIVGTVLLVLAIIAAVLFFVWVGAEIDTYQDGTGTSV